jgi:uncharacterized protein YkwD
MGWSTHRTSEMPSVPNPIGRHRKPRTGRIAAAIVVALVGIGGVGAAFSPSLLGGSQPLTAAPASSKASTAALSVTTPTTTATASSTMPTPTTAPTETTTSQPEPGSPLASFEQSVVKLVNDERARKAGCRALRTDSGLQDAARAHSMEMARYRYHSHTGRNGSEPWERMTAAGYDVRSGWAENIAQGYATPAAVMAGWMSSADHKANILNCELRAIGVGSARATNGEIYWTQDFGGR